MTSNNLCYACNQSSCIFFLLVSNNAAQEIATLLGDALTLVHLYFGCAVDESFWGFDLVVIGCCS